MIAGFRSAGCAVGLLLVVCGCGSFDDAEAVDASGAPDVRPDAPPAANQDATLVALEVSAGTLAPVFDPSVTSYTVDLPLDIESISVTPTAAVPDGVTITVNGTTVASGAASPPMALDLGPNAIDVVVSTDGGSSRSYAITASRGAGIAPQAYVKASNTGAEDWFGGGVALSGDTLAVSASGEDGHRGAVYVFVRSGTTWSQQAYLKASNSDSEDRFGWGVALDGDTLAVGAVQEDSAATGVGGDEANDSAIWSGAAYVFVRSGTIWSQQAYVKASNTGTLDWFGKVALDGDTLAVGASLEDSAATGVGGDQTDNSATRSGAVYVFSRSGTTWSQHAYVKASNTDGEDEFGKVALAGGTLAVGARLEDSAATGIDGDQTDNSAANSGAVYVFQ